MEQESVIVRRTTFMERMKARSVNFFSGLSYAVSSYTGLKVLTTFEQFAPYKAAEAKQALQDNPDLYAAIERRALTIAALPINLYESDRPDANAIQDDLPWVAKFRNLIKRPCYEDIMLDFPFLSGKEVHAQLIADLILCGTCAVHIIYDEKTKTPIGYERVDIEELRYDAAAQLYYRIPRSDMMHKYYFQRGRLATVRTVSTDPYLAFGIGAYQPIRYLITAAIDALKLLAKQAQQGALSFILSAKNEQGVAMLSDPGTRKRLTSEVKKILKDGNGFGIFPGMLDVNPVSIKPADLQSLNIAEAAANGVLNATGTTAMALGNKALNFSVGAVQTKVQQEMDSALGGLFCEKFLTPLAQVFARQERYPGYSTIETDIDFSGTYASTTQRTDALNRAQKLWQFGADPMDALYAEQIYNVKLTSAPRFGNSGNSDLTSATQQPEEPTVLGDGLADGRPDKQTV